MRFLDKNICDTWDKVSLINDKIWFYPTLLKNDFVVMEQSSLHFR